MLSEKELHIFILLQAMQIMLEFGRSDSGLRAAPFVYLKASQQWAPRRGRADAEVRVCSQCLPLTCLLCLR